MSNARTRTAILVLLMLIVAACGRDESASSDDGGDDGTSTTAPGDDDGGGTDGGDDPTSLSQGGFGDLEAVCQEGDASGATAPGVTDSQIVVGTVSDKGSTAVPGLNEEMFDTAAAFVAWCNEHGGILGREIVLSDADAKLFDYEPAVTDACGRDFALVGGGAVFDDDPNGVRVGCNLPNIAGYVVSAPARVAELQVQPVPNPIYNIAMGRYAAAKAQHPDGVDRFAVMASALPSVLLVKQQTIETAEQMGFELVYQLDYQTQGETGWASFVREMQSADVKILDFIGQPQNLVQLTQEMDLAGWYPEVILLSGNFYDDLFSESGGETAGNLYIQSVFHPLEMASENKATQDYLDLMDQYNPGGKVALLGLQGMSSWLLFAEAATACGSDLTPECLLDRAAAQADWTAGGLHARQTPGNAVASPCMLLLGVDGEGFHYLEDATAPTDGDGLFNCDEGNVIDLAGDYGVPRPEA